MCCLKLCYALLQRKVGADVVWKCFRCDLDAVHMLFGIHSEMFWVWFGWLFAAQFLPRPSVRMMGGESAHWVSHCH